MVAVFDVSADGMKLPPKTIKRLTDYMGTRLTIGGTYQVMPESAIKEAMIELKIESQNVCYDDKCRVELGRAAAAQKNLNTLIWKIGNECSVTGTIFDLRKEASDKAAEVSGIDCSEASLKKGIAQVAMQLSGKSNTSVTTQIHNGNSDLPPPPDRVLSSGNYEEGEVPPVKEEVGFLSVEGTPRGARVDISGPRGFGDNGLVSTVLPVRPFQVPAGDYRIKVSFDEYDIDERNAHVSADATEIVKIDLLSAWATLEISGSPEGARSSLSCQNGFSREFGLPDRPWRVRVPRGDCHINTQRDGYETYDANIAALGGQVTSVNIGLSKNSKGINWIRLPAGSFEMGSNSGRADEKPVHRVNIKSFEISKAEVTQKQYQACIDAGACTAPHWDDGTCFVSANGEWVQSVVAGNLKNPDLPVACVEWDQARAYARWVGARLPTEAEWEYAARSGGKQKTFPWGEANATCDKAVMFEVDQGCGRVSTWPPCSKTDGNTEQGVCDMSGNVWEWTEDWYHENYVGAPTDGSAWLYPVGTTRVMRGGPWVVVSEYLRNATRDRLSVSCYGLGIRLVR